MNRRFAIQCMGVAALGLGTEAVAAVPLRHARAGTASVLAVGAAGADMLEHALLWGQCDWAPLESSWAWQHESPQAGIVMADLSEPGVCEALAASVEAAASRGLVTLAILEGESAAVDEHTLRLRHRIQQRADLVISLPKERSRKEVVWEGVLSPFMEDCSICLAVDDLRDPAWRKASATVGCGWGATPTQAMLVAMADPTLAASGARELGDMLVALTFGNPHTLLRDVYEACKLLRTWAPHGRLGMSFRSRPSLGPLVLVHLVALQPGK